eukprot:1151490-Pelagomonas_calceolata.AAC.1
MWKCRDTSQAHHVLIITIVMALDKLGLEKAGKPGLGKALEERGHVDKKGLEGKARLARDRSTLPCGNPVKQARI